MKDIELYSTVCMEYTVHTEQRVPFFTLRILTGEMKMLYSQRRTEDCVKLDLSELPSFYFNGDINA